MKKLSFFSFLVISFFSFSQEICNNAIDDDGDGLVDLNDPDCDCAASGNEPFPGSFVVNESFELKDCCPTTFGEMSCATNWSQATAGATDFLNDCGFVGPFANTNLYPFPDGQGASAITITSDYKEYLGTCLSNPLLAGNSYTLKFYVGMTLLTADGSANCQSTLANYADSIDFVLYGATNCGNLPLNTFDCPTSVSASFQLLGSTNVSVDTNGYQLITIQFTPGANIQEILIGTDCIMPAIWPSSQDVVNSNCAPYFVLDQLVINETDQFVPVQIASSGSHCSNNLSLQGQHPNLGAGAGQWYLNGEALLAQTSDNLNVSAGNYGGGLYTFQYETASGCYRDTLSVTAPDNLFLQGYDTTLCMGETIDLTAQGNAVQYNWAPNSSIISITGPTATVQPLVNTSFQVEGQSAHGCTQTANFNVFVAPVPSGVSITSSPNEISDLGQFLASPPTYAYTWTLPDGSVVNSEEATYHFNSIPGIYTLLLEAANDSGCYSYLSYSVEIETIDDLAYYIPNAFSPDGNEFNATFKPVLSPKIDAYDYHLWIYDRKGNVLFESLNPQIGWDGTFNNQVVPSGIYAWKLEVGFANDGSMIDERGFVFLAK